MAKSFNLIEFYIKDVHFPNKKPDNAHKYDFGILFVYGGERPYGGAALLCIQTALKTGIGIVYSLFHGSQNHEILHDAFHLPIARTQAQFLRTLQRLPNILKEERR